MNSGCYLLGAPAWGVRGSRRLTALSPLPACLLWPLTPQVTLERSVLVQDSSRYELVGEYVLPGTRSWAAAAVASAGRDGAAGGANGGAAAGGKSNPSTSREGGAGNEAPSSVGVDGDADSSGEWGWNGASEEAEGGASERTGEAETEAEELLTWAMPPQMHALMRGVGRWRLRLDVPHAEVAELLPAARLLSSSYDPAALLRSKEDFLQTVPLAGISADNLQQQLEVRCRVERGAIARGIIVIDMPYENWPFLWVAGDHFHTLPSRFRR